MKGIKRSTAYQLLVGGLIAIAYLVVAEYFIGWRVILYPWRFLPNPAWILLPTALILLTYLLRASRVYIYFRLQSKFGICLKLTLQHGLLVNLLPMRAGELSFPILMKRYFSLPLAQTVPALVWLRLLDLHALILIGLLTWGVIVSFAVALPALGLWLAALPLAYLLANKLQSVDGRGKLIGLLQRIIASAPRDLGQLVGLWAMTIANWILKLLAFGWIVKIFAKTDYAVALAGAIGGELASISPVQGIAALGTYEAGIVAVMHAAGVSVNDALTGGANLHLVLLGASLLGGLLSLLILTPNTDLLPSDVPNIDREYSF